jgi:hypothetical protein
LGIGDWVFGIGPNPQSPIPNPQSPIPNPQSKYKNFKIIIFKYTIFMKFNYFNVINKNIYILKNRISLFINIIID